MPWARSCSRDRTAAAAVPCPSRCEQKTAADRQAPTLASRPYSGKMTQMKDADARALLRDLFDAALAAARPATCLAPYIDKLQPPKGRTVVIGAGKASAAMARAVEDRWHHPIEGLVVTRYGYGETCKRIEIVEAAHPVPDEKGRAAAGRILQKVKGLSADDLVLCLISGGASALLALPAPGLTLSDKQAVNRALLKSGANIVEMNTVRKHLSAIKGGRLAVAAPPAPVLSWP